MIQQYSLLSPSISDDEIRAPECSPLCGCPSIETETRALPENRCQVSTAAEASIDRARETQGGLTQAANMSTVLPSTSNDRECAQTLRTFAGSSSSQTRRRSRVCGVLACLLLTGPARAGPAGRRGIITGFVGRAPATTPRSARDSETEQGSAHSHSHSLRRGDDGWNRKRNTRRRGVASMTVTTGAAELQAETAAQQSR